MGSMIKRRKSRRPPNATGDQAKCSTGPQAWRTFERFRREVDRLFEDFDRHSMSRAVQDDNEYAENVRRRLSL